MEIADRADFFFFSALVFPLPQIKDRFAPAPEDAGGKRQLQTPDFSRAPH